MMTVKAGALEGLTKEMLESGTHIWAKVSSGGMTEGRGRMEQGNTRVGGEGTERRR
jgi:hypothetical protein